MLCTVWNGTRSSTLITAVPGWLSPPRRILTGSDEVGSAWYLVYCTIVSRPYSSVRGVSYRPCCVPFFFLAHFACPASATLTPGASGDRHGQRPARGPEDPAKRVDLEQRDERPRAKGDRNHEGWGREGDRRCVAALSIPSRLRWLPLNLRFVERVRTYSSTTGAAGLVCSFIVDNAKTCCKLLAYAYVRHATGREEPSRCRIDEFAFFDFYDEACFFVTICLACFVGIRPSTGRANVPRPFPPTSLRQPTILWRSWRALYLCS